MRRNVGYNRTVQQAKTKRHFIKYLHLNLCFTGFTKSTLLGFDIYLTNSIPAWYITGYSIVYLIKLFLISILYRKNSNHSHSNFK